MSNGTAFAGISGIEDNLERYTQILKISYHEFLFYIIFLTEFQNFRLNVSHFGDWKISDVLKTVQGSSRTICLRFEKFRKLWLNEKTPSVFVQPCIVSSSSSLQTICMLEFAE